MKLLAIDTSEDFCSAALWIDGEVASRHRSAPRRHSELVLPMMDELLADAGLDLRRLDALAFGRGPGSFTGVRVAAAVVQGAAFAADLPVVPVSTLLALAQGARREHAAERVLAALDARMHEVYWMTARPGAQGVMEPAGPERVDPPEAVSLGEDERGSWTGVGSGWASYAEPLRAAAGGRIAQSHPDVRVQAPDIAALAVSACGRGEAVSAERALPVYLRDRVAWKQVR